MLQISFSDFSINIYDTLQGAEDLWNQILPVNHHLLSPQLLVLEKSQSADITFRYLVIQNKEKEIAGVIYFQKLRFGSDNYNASSGILLRLLKPILKKKCINILICGNLFRVEFTAVFFNSDKINASEIISIIDRFFETEKSSALLLKDVEFGNREKEKLSELRYTVFASDMTMKLSIKESWNSLDDYLNALTKKYRQRAKKIFISKNKMVIRELREDEIKSREKEIGILFNNVSEKQVIRMGIIQPNYFIEMKNVLKDKFTIQGYFLNEKLIAFSSHIEYDYMLEVHYIGIDYQYNNEYNLYFNILFGGVERAIRLQKKTLELGRTAREAKAIVGCKPVYFTSYMKIRSRAVSFLLNVFVKYFQANQGNEWMNRNPFKE